MIKIKLSTLYIALFLLLFPSSLFAQKKEIVDRVDFTQKAIAPSNPDTGFTTLYIDNSNLVHILQSNGTDTTLMSGSGFVSSITGTPNQVIASGSTGNITLSLPQSIATTSNPTFAGITLTGFSGFVRASGGVLSASSLVAGDIPDLSSTYATLSGSQALTNKTYNGMGITPNSGTLALANAKVFTTTSTMTLGSADGATIAFGSGGTVTYTSNNLSVFASTTSAQLATLLSDETGTGLAVFNNTPNFVTGFTIGGSAPSGHYLRGNGTNYIDDTIQASDIPDISATYATLTGSQTLQNKTLNNTNSYTIKDGSLTLQNSISTTKQAIFDLSNITAANTRTVYVPDSNTYLPITSQQITWSGLTAARTYTLPDTSTTLVGIAATQTLTNKTIAGGSNTISGITETMLSFSDITTLNVSTTQHGLVPKAPNDATKYLDGTGAWSVPAGAGGGVGGSGTTGYMPYFSASTTLANSPLQVSGSNVGWGLSPSYKIDLTGTGSTIYFHARNSDASTTTSSILMDTGFSDSVRLVWGTRGTGNTSPYNGHNIDYIGAGLTISNSGTLVQKFTTNAKSYFPVNVGFGTVTDPSFYIDIAGAGSTVMQRFRNSDATTTTSGSIQDIGFNDSYRLVISSRGTGNSAPYNGHNIDYIGAALSISNNGTGVLTFNTSSNAVFRSTSLFSFGGTTSSFPALKNSSAALQARLGDDSDYSEFDAKFLALTHGTITSATPTLNSSVTWNSGGTTFTGWKLNVTDSASAIASLLMDLQVGGTSKFSVKKDGTVTTGIWNGTAIATSYGGTGYSSVSSIPANLDQQATSTFTTTTVAETTVYTYTLAAGAVSTTGHSYTKAILAFSTTTGQNPTFTIRVKVGATTIASYTTGTISGNVSNITIPVDLFFANKGATGANLAVATISDPGTAGDQNSATGQTNTVKTYENNALTIDTTATVAVTITVQPSVSNANVKFACYNGYTEVSK